MSKVSFVHCSDIHLGCQQFNEIQRWHDFGAIFSEIVDYALENKVDFVLISGDLFHHRSINAPTLGQAMELLGKLKNAQIQVIAIEGNHDKAFYLERDSWMSFLNQQGFIRLLKPDFEEGKLALKIYNGKSGCITEICGVQIIGLGYLGATTRQRLEEVVEQIAVNDKFTIMMLHAAVDKLLGQDLAGVRKEVFDAFADRVDYFALGHIHSRHEIDNLIFNPGAPECVHVDEAKEGKEKGFYHVTIEGKNKEVRYVNSKHRAVRRFYVNLTGIVQPTEIIPKVLEALEASDVNMLDKPIAQIILYGTINFSSFAIDSVSLAELVTEKYKCLTVEVVNNTNLPIDSGTVEFSGFDRLKVEKHVLRQMISEEKPQWNDVQQDMVDLILQIKNDSLAGAAESDLISAVESFIDAISLSEVAVAADERGEAK